MKNFNAKVLLFVLVAFYLSMGSSAMAQYTVGVKSGDWIKYNFTMSGGGQTVQGWIKITIQSVSGTQVTGTYAVGMSGQQLQQLDFTLDIATGYGTMSGFIIPANLDTGQAIPGEGTTVQGITTRHGRTAIYATATDPYSGWTGQVYWDQATGVLLETSTSYGGYTYTITPAETNMWSTGLFGPGFLGLDWWIWIVIIVVIVVVIVAAAIILRKRKPPVAPAAPAPAPQEQPPQPPPPPPPPPPTP
ncbi:MAG: hypothetical protein QXN36_05560 [Candidatus Bathyarchaeia archaeon]